MTKIIEVSEETYELIKDQLGKDLKEIKSMEELVGENYLFQCARYIYHGKVKSVNSTYIVIKGGVVFETGDYSDKSPKDKQDLPYDIHIMRQAIESFYKMKW